MELVTYITSHNIFKKNDLQWNDSQVIMSSLVASLAYLLHETEYFYLFDDISSSSDYKIKLIKRLVINEFEMRCTQSLPNL
jgi:hypothetical protein